MKYLFLTLSLLSFSLLAKAQNIPVSSLWKAASVYDTLGTKYPRGKVQRFLYLENEHQMSVLTLYERMSMTTGEMIVSYTIEGSNLEKTTDKVYEVREMAAEQFELIHPDSLYYKESHRHLGFQRIAVQPSTLTRRDLLAFLLEGSVREYDDQGTASEQILSYHPTGSKTIQTVGSSYVFDSPYRVLNFEGFLFIKGITSAPLLVEKLEQGIVYGKEADYRFAIKKFELRQEKQ